MKKRIDRLRERLIGVLVEVRHGDPRREERVIRVDSGHGGRGLCREVVKLGRGHAVIKALDDLHRDLDDVDKTGVKPVGEFFDPRGDLVERDFFAVAVTFDYLHHSCSDGCGGLRMVDTFVSEFDSGFGWFAFIMLYV